MQTWKTTGRNDRVSDTNCRNCGHPVTTDFTRVHGDTSNRVYACPECTNYTDINKSAAARPPAARTDGGRDQ